jgi:hypothetical protein
VYKTLKVHPSHYSATEWVDSRKKKTIVLQELDEVDHTLEFIKGRDGRQRQMEDLEGALQCFNRIVEYLALLDFGAIFYKAPHK